MNQKILPKFNKKTNLLPESLLSDYFEEQNKFKEVINLINNGDLKKASLTALELLNEYKDKEEIPTLIFDSFLIYLETLVIKSEFVKIKNLLQEYKELIDIVSSSSDEFFIEKMILYNILLGIRYQNQGNYSESSKYFLKAQSNSRKLKKSKLENNVNINIGNNYVYLNKTTEALNIYLESLKDCKNNSLETETFILLNNISLTYMYDGELDKSIEYFSQAKNIVDDNKLHKIALDFNLGLFDFLKGQITESNSKFESCLNFYNDNELNYELGLSYLNLSSISEFKGDVVQSQSDLSNSFTLFNELQNENLISIVNNNLANLSLISGDFESASNTYKKCYEDFQTANFNHQVAITLFNLISLAVLENNEELKFMYSNKINQLSSENNKKIINLISTLSKALTLKQADRMVKLAEAQQIFMNISNDQNINVIHEFKLIALKNLSEMLIQELSSSGDPEVIEELKEVLDKILEIANKENSQLLKAESFLIQSKLDLLDLKINESRSLLSQAQVIAEDRGITSLAIFISKEYDNLLNQQGKIEEAGDKNLSMNERLEIAELENMVNKLIRRRAELPEITEENPFMFLVIAMSGMSVFSKIFVEEDLMDEQLIGGFITAINIVTQQAFSDQEAIEGIRHQDFTLLLKYIGDTRILCVYVFKGQTYFAMQKLNAFIETIQYSEPMEVLNEANDIGKIISEDPGMVEIVSKIFETGGEETPQKISTNFFSQKVTATINQGILLPGINMSFNTMK